MDNEAFLGNCIAEFRSHYDDNPTKIPVSEEQIELWRRQSEISKAHLLYTLGYRLTRDFYRNELESDFCSTFMRNLQRASFDEWTNLFWNTYIAFDASETSHFGQDGDPVETHTRPMIKKIIDKQR